MLAYLLLGATFGFAAVVQPGPLQAWLISQAASHGWRRALPGAFSPLVSDGPIVLTAVLALSRLAFGAFQALRAGDRKAAAPQPTASRSLFKATFVNLLNPNPWISWILVLGPLLVKGWREAPARGIALLAGFYGVVLLGLIATVALFGMAGKSGGGVQRALAAISAAALAAFGAYLLWSGLNGGGRDPERLLGWRPDHVAISHARAAGYYLSRRR